MAIDTNRVTGRRVLSFSTCDEILAEAERLAASSTCQQLGNWNLGQACFHLASAMNMSLDGTKSRVPFFIRWIGKLLRNRVLSQPMRAGFKLPSSAKRELVAEQPVPVEQGLDMLRQAVGRLARESQRFPHPVFGPLDRDQWNRLHCRHAELHLSFFLPCTETNRD